VSIARRFGTDVTEPIVLHASNNVVVHLSPSPIVAKVTTASERLAHELAVAEHLAAEGAPTAEPSSDLPLKVHRYGGLAATFCASLHASCSARTSGFWRCSPERRSLRGQSTAHHTAETF
jgi:hypothetical protein